MVVRGAGGDKITGLWRRGRGAEGARSVGPIAGVLTEVGQGRVGSWAKNGAACVIVAEKMKKVVVR